MSKSTELNKELKGIEAELAKINDTKKALGNKAAGILKDLINKTDLIEAVRWTQYTPYFMDGEECVFGVHDIEFKFSDKLHDTSPLNKGTKKDDDDEDYDDDGFIYSWGDQLDKFLDSKREVVNYKEIDALEGLVKDIQHAHSVLSSLGSDLKDMLGDHVRVTVTRSGIETEEYEHE